MIGTTSSPEKAALAKKNGYKWVIDYTKENVVEKVKEITEPPPKFEVAIAQADDPEPVKLGVGAKINKPLFPDPDNAWNRDISQEPVDPMSDAIIRRIGADRPLHPEFGAVYRGAPNGIPYTVVSGDQPKVPVFFDRYGEQSDKEPYPIPAGVQIEGGPQGTRIAKGELADEAAIETRFDVFLQILARHLSLDDAIAKGLVRLEGNERTLRRLPQWFDLATARR